MKSRVESDSEKYLGAPLGGLGVFVVNAPRMVFRASGFDPVEPVPGLAAAMRDSEIGGLCCEADRLHAPRLRRRDAIRSRTSSQARPCSPDRAACARRRISVSHSSSVRSLTVGAAGVLASRSYARSRRASAGSASACFRISSVEGSMTCGYRRHRRDARGIDRTAGGMNHQGTKSTKVKHQWMR